MKKILFSLMLMATANSALGMNKKIKAELVKTYNQDETVYALAFGPLVTFHSAKSSAPLFKLDNVESFKFLTPKTIEVQERKVDFTYTMLIKPFNN